MKTKEYREMIYHFIDYLHENTDAFQSDMFIIDEMAGLEKEYNGLNRKRYNEKKSRDSIGKEIDKLRDSLKCIEIPRIAKQIGLYQFNTIEIKNNLTGCHPDFDDSEFTRLTKAKEKYMMFRDNIDVNKILLGIFFHDLTIGLASLFAGFVDVSDMVGRFKITKFDSEEGIDPPKKPIPQPSTADKIYSFETLFKNRHRDKIPDFKKWLIKEGFVNAAGDLRCSGTNFARLYYLLQDMGVMTPGIPNKKGITAFFKEFGIEVVERVNKGENTNQITRRAVMSDGAKEITQLIDGTGSTFEKNAKERLTGIFKND